MEEFARIVQRILGEEVTGHLGRGRSGRRSAVDSRERYRNGCGRPPAALR
ncbi:MAG: hypothetical protein Q6359_00245 [Candidatus Brocadiales bacterium]|nr:hypothetical protein [Candidatus Brocadiales bacterium]